MADWLAYIRIEGLDTPKRRDFRAGQVCSVVSNFSTWETKEPFKASDFFLSLREDEKEPEPILMADPEAQARLIMSQVFGTTPEQAYKKG